MEKKNKKLFSELNYTTFYKKNQMWGFGLRRGNMAKEKDSVIFYKSHYLVVKDFSNEQLGRLYRALFEKQLGNEVVLENDIKIAFNFINNQMLVDEKKYKEKSEKLSENGKKGGAPKGNKNACKTTETTKTSKNKQNNLNDNVNDKL